MSLEAFRREPPAVEALLTATGAGVPILNQAALERLAAHTISGQPPLIVETMAVPGDVDAALSAKLAIPRVGMDAIVQHAEQSRAARLIEAGPAREQIDRALDDCQTVSPSATTARYSAPCSSVIGARRKKA